MTNINIAILMNKCTSYFTYISGVVGGTTGGSIILADFSRTTSAGPSIEASDWLDIVDAWLCLLED